MPPTQDASTSSPIGRRTPRVDGPQKVTGQAKYTADFRLPGNALRGSRRSHDRQRSRGQARHIVG